MNEQKPNSIENIITDDFIVLEDNDDPLCPIPVKAQSLSSEKELKNHQSLNIFKSTVVQTEPKKKPKTQVKNIIPFQTEKINPEWINLIETLKNSIYESFLRKSTFLASSTCNFYEPLLTAKFSASLFICNLGLVISLDLADNRILYNQNYFIVPFCVIEEIRNPGKSNNSVKRFYNEPDYEQVIILTKDFRSITLFANNSRNLFRELPHYFHMYNSSQNFFGLHFKTTWEYRSKMEFDFVSEYKRQGVKCEFEHIIRENKLEGIFPFHVIDNFSKKGKICETYPKYAIVPSVIKSELLKDIANFRSHARFPILSYFWRERKVYLWRGSQCRSGISGSRCAADEFLLSLMHNPVLFSSISEMYTASEKHRAVDVHLYDARDRLAVFGNMISGKGGETAAYYRNCQISFNNLPNMNSIQSSYQKLCKTLTNLETEHLTEVKEWTENIALVLQLTSKVVQSMSTGVSVFVHCSDGWDRTSQVTALAQLAIDPYFRTIGGFIDLIEKEFVYFGHQFSKRTGMGIFDKSNYSPIFLQYMNCVYQMFAKSSEMFEFNESFLVDITLFSYSGVFGEFLASSFLEREEHKLDFRTVSLNEYFCKYKEKYLNPNFDSSYRETIFIPTKTYNMKFWKGLFYFFLKKEKNLEFEVPLI